MLRITGGDFRGRLIRSPSSLRVRPTGSRAREAIFNVLGSPLDKARTLDLFSGSGLLGFEALSRGAASVTFVDSWPGAVSIIAANAGDLGVKDRTRVIKSTWETALRRLQDEGKTFDLVFADPPYAFFLPGGQGEKLLATLGACAIVTARGILVLEHSVEAVLPPLPAGWDLLVRKNYGREAVCFFKRGETDGGTNGNLRGNV